MTVGLIATDMDGTFVDEQGKLSTRNVFLSF